MIDRWTDNPRARSRRMAPTGTGACAPRWRRSGPAPAPRHRATAQAGAGPLRRRRSRRNQRAHRNWRQHHPRGIRDHLAAGRLWRGSLRTGLAVRARRGRRRHYREPGAVRPARHRAGRPRRVPTCGDSARGIAAQSRLAEFTVLAARHCPGRPSPDLAQRVAGGAGRGAPAGRAHRGRAPWQARRVGGDGPCSGCA